MLESYFSIEQQLQLAASFLLIFFSIISFEWLKKEKLALYLLLSGVFCYKLFFILLDPYLHVWDEQVHALVAKNLSANFLKPTLYPEAILPYDYKAWPLNYIWVHKQPLFLWQIAISYKIFGVSIFALRLPSLLCATLTVFFVYKIGKNFANSRIGFYAALFYGLNYYFNEVLAGYFPTDHNDIVFLCYVTASIWAFSEHVINPSNKKWILLIGLLAGLAVLTKWMVGLLVYSGWFFYTAIKNKKQFYKISHYYQHFSALLITISVALPWQIYILWRFPKESRYEFAYNSKHLNEVIEGHAGNNWFYIDSLNETIGHYSPFFILLGIYFLSLRSKNKEIYSTILFYVILVLAFFTYAATKMPAFSFVIYSFIFIGFGAIVDKTYDALKHIKFNFSKIILFALLLLFSFSFTNMEKVQEQHTYWKKNIPVRNNRHFITEWKKVCEYISSLKIDKSYVFFNCPDYCEVPLMFYTDHLGYWGLPNENQIQIVKSKNKKVALIDNGNIPQTFYERKDILIVTPPKLKIKSVSSALLITNKQFVASNNNQNAFLSNEYDKALVELVQFEDGICKIRTKGELYLKWRPNNNSIYFATKNNILEEGFIINNIHGNLFNVTTVFNESALFTDDNFKNTLLMLYKI